MTSLRIAMSGDVAITNALTTHPFSTELRQLLKRCDISILNLELPIVQDKSLAEAKAGVNANLAQHQSIDQILSGNDFTHVNLCNNHMMDFGTEGLINTMKIISRYNLSFFGAATDRKNLFTPYIVEKDGITIAFITGCETQTGVWKYDDQDAGVPWIMDPLLIQSITKIRKQVDVLIMLPHAGLEKFDTPLPEWRNIYKQFIDHGCDLVVASHPHIIQGKEKYRDKYIYYSTGNLIFNNNLSAPGWNNALVLEISIRKDNKQIDIKDHFFSRSPNGLLEPDDGTVQQHFLQLSSDLLSRDRYMSAVEQTVVEAWSRLYKDAFNFSPTSEISLLKFYRRKMKNRHGKINETLLLSLIRNETVRFVCERALRTIYDLP